MTDFFSSQNLISLISLCAMEIVLGIDNIIFVAILSQRVERSQQKRARRLGISLALVLRLGLLFTLSWIMGLTKPLFTVLGQTISGRDLVLLLGGLFLMFKSTHEIYDKLEGDHGEDGATAGPRTSFALILGQILLLDIVFSLDSVITAVGMVPNIPTMVVAMIVAVIVMLIFADSVSDFVSRHPSVKILALSFLLLIGFLLVADGLGKHVPKAYVYFAMAFSLLVELLNMRFRRKKRPPVTLHQRFESDSDPPPTP